jgi:hypothetical protein
MRYESPKTLRHRQVAAESRAPRKRRQQAVKISSTTEWAKTQNFHLIRMAQGVREGDLSLTQRHADALVRLSLDRRAKEIMLALGLRSYWKASDIARREMVISLERTVA